VSSYTRLLMDSSILYIFWSLFLLILWLYTISLFSMQKMGGTIFILFFIFTISYLIHIVTRVFLLYSLLYSCECYWWLFLSFSVWIYTYMSLWNSLMESTLSLGLFLWEGFGARISYGRDLLFSDYSRRIPSVIPTPAGSGIITERNSPSIHLLSVCSILSQSGVFLHHHSRNIFLVPNW
jgi:hypothetical protein